MQILLLNSSRRDLLKAGGLALASVYLGKVPVILAEEQPNKAIALHVRKDVGTLAIDDPILVTYRKAVTAMQALPPDDPRNWNAQARIHNDRCPHGNWFFLPWHRAYLYYFEDICREVTGDKAFALPYWNWTKDPQVPAAFWGDNNPLAHPREVGANDTIEPEFVGPTVIEEIIAKTDFQDFASFKSTKQRGGVGGGKRELEFRPHDNIHGFIGGHMATVSMSALDPIFWLHHANIDRIWAKWNELGRANTNDPIWTNYVFQGDFVAANKHPQNKPVSEVTSTYALQYRYDDQAETPTRPTVTPKPLIRVPELTMSASNKESAKSRIPLGISVPANARFLAAAESIAEADSLPLAATRLTEPEPKEQTVRLRISQVTPPRNKRAFARVFINCPYLSEKTPINDPHYVATLGFFGANHEGSDHAEGPEYVLDLTDTLAKLNRSKNFPTDKIDVQLLALPRGKDVAGAEVLAGKFEITVATATGEA